MSRSAGKSLLAGAAAGLAGSLVMNGFQRLWASAAGRDKSHGAQTLRTGGPRTTQSEAQQGGGDDPAEKVAAIAVETATGETLNQEQSEKAGTLVHYVFGAATGALYSVAADRFPTVTAGAGAAFGLAVWVGAELITVPGFGLSRKPHEYPLWVELYGASAHIVYGVATELARRQL